MEEKKDKTDEENTEIEESEEDEKTKCPYGLCDGSGEYDEGEFDDIRTVKCLCKIDQEDDFTGATEGDR